MPKFPFLFIISMLLLFGCSDRENINYIRKVTNISLPADIKVIAEYDNGETISIGKYRLKTNEIAGFMANKSFRKVDMRFPPLSQFNAFDKKEAMSLDDSTNLRYFTGCNPDNSWLFTINITTGDLWVEVQYPDPGGLSPGCDTSRNRATH